MNGCGLFLYEDCQEIEIILITSPGKNQPESYISSNVF